MSLLFGAVCLFFPLFNCYQNSFSRSNSVASLGGSRLNSRQLHFFIYLTFLVVGNRVPKADNPPLVFVR